MDVLGVHLTNKGYKLIKPLVKNEYHEIVLAKRLSDGQKVVLKQSLLVYDNISRVSKIGHEHNILKDLDHKGIPKVHEVLFDEQSIVMVQEYVEGASLKEHIFKSRFNTAEVLDIAIQLAEILHYIHQEGVIHKDINTGNIMIARDGTLKLLDFAISSNIQVETNDMLNVDQIEGSLIYISPEQTGRTAYSVTHTCDFYSFGVLLYELLAGKPPFDSIDPLEIIHFHLSRNPVSLSSILPDITEGIEELISKLMEKNPDDRYHSALGLKADLETIKKHHLSKEPLLNFNAGSNDLSGQYKQSQKLYGRVNEQNELLDYYKNLHHLKSMIVLVAGYSGVGKSALIKHIKFPIIQNHGNFISGKFDQFKKDIPYYAFIEAIQEFIRTLLSEPEDKINYWRERISAVLGDNAGLITEVIPQLSKIIKNQPPVPKLQPAEQETRFNMVLLDFIYVFSTPGSPLVIFLDDLQWADLSSLNLVKRIVENPRQDSILILGAYRDNEVEKGHPLLITLKQINVTQEQLKIVQIKPLDLETTCRITADSFSMDKEQANKLGQKVFSKTKGNPFFIHSFLKSLYDRKQVKSETGNQWIWNEKEIDELDYTDNVIDLMTEGLIVLPLQTQEILKYAAVLGNTFNLADLSEITQKSQSAVYSYLKPAIQEGYINSNDKQYRALALSSINLESDIEQQLSDKAATFTFTHDKVQQAAYGLISTAELKSVHLKIGRLLLLSRNETELHEEIFELLNHFALCSDLIEEGNEKKKITELCLIAGRKAKESTAYSLGVRFLKMGENLLGLNSWIDNYTLTFNVLFELGECEYLNDNPVKAEQYFKELLGHSKTNFEKLKVYYLHSSLYIKIGNTNESLRLGLEAVKLYHIHFPKNKMAIQLATLLTLVKHLILFSTKYRNPNSLSHIQDCTDEEIIALNKFLIDLAVSAYQQDKNLMMLVIFRIIKSYLKDGFTDASGWGFSGFSVVVLSALYLQKGGFTLWDLTIRLHQKTHSPLIKWRLNYTVLTFNNVWRYPFSEGLDKVLETIKACVINGDQIFTGYAVALYQRWSFMAGENLDSIIQSSEDHHTLVQNHGGLDFFHGFYQLVKALNGQTFSNSWDDKSFSGAETLERFTKEGNKTKLAFFHTARCAHLYYFDHHREALDESQIALPYADNFLGDLLEAFLAFFTSLSITACFENLTTSEQKKYRKVLKKNIHKMKMWSKGCSANFIQHYHLLKAEKYSIENKFEKALHHYEQSLQLAAENKLKYIEAIANERAALLCIKNQFIKQSKTYMQDAWEAYAAWGANAKCLQLENAHPSILKDKLDKNKEQRNITPSDTFSASKTALDLASVLKASQSIAGEVKYDELLKRLMHITIENAGAERGCLILFKDNQLHIEAEGITGSEEVTLFNALPMSDSELVPKSMVNYCWRSEENVVVNDAINEDRFKADPYIKKHQTISAMCLPITSQGKISGLLYLENNLIKGAFNKNRIKLLQMLSGQIGISIDNSLLYSNLEEKVLERTKEIEKQKVQLEEEKEKSDLLLLNILPKRTADELKSTGRYQAQSYKNVTVMFCDIVGFTSLGEKLDADTLVNELHEFFSGVDDIVKKFQIEKIKTIGDAYLCVAGLDDDEGGKTTCDMIYASLEIIEFIKKLNTQKEEENRQTFQLRIGVHFGPLTAGVVGKSKYAYDIWGDTVNTASRMESSGKPGRINISGDTHAIVKNNFECEYRGKISAKNKGDIDMYFVHQPINKKIEKDLSKSDAEV